MQDLARELPASGNSAPLRNSRGYLLDDDSQNERTEIAAKDGSLIGKISLSHPELALSDVLRRVPSVTVQPTQVTTAMNSRFMMFTARGEELGRFETALDDSSTVLDPLTIERTTDCRVYRVKLTDDARWITPGLILAGARPLDIRSSNRLWELRGQFRSRAALDQFREYCAENDFSFVLNQLYWTSGGDQRTDFGLSPKQLEIARKAHQSGYFDVPRQVSQQELADQLDISSSAVSQRLRRATAQILEETVSSDDTAGLTE